MVVGLVVVVGPVVVVCLVVVVGLVMVVRLVVGTDVVVVTDVAVVDVGLSLSISREASIPFTSFPPSECNNGINLFDS